MNSPAYVIGHITVKDEAKWAEYRSQVPATLAPWGAELVCHDFQPLALASQTQHGLRKIAAVCAKYPTGTENKMVCSARL